MTALDKQARELADSLENDIVQYNTVAPQLGPYAINKILAFATQVREHTVAECAAVVEREILKRPENSDYVNPYGFAAAIRRLNAAPPETTEQDGK